MFLLHVCYLLLQICLQGGNIIGYRTVFAYIKLTHNLSNKSGLNVEFVLLFSADFWYEIYRSG